MRLLITVFFQFIMRKHSFISLNRVIRDQTQSLTHLHGNLAVIRWSSADEDMRGTNLTSRGQKNPKTMNKNKSCMKQVKKKQL